VSPAPEAGSSFLSSSASSAEFGLEDVVVLPGGTALVPELVTTETGVTQWRRLLELLVSGVCIRLSTDAARFLLESRPVRSQSRAGFVLDIDGRLVRVWRDDDGWLGEALPRPSSRGCSCSLDCVVGPDGWEVVVCVCCGQAW
jgi:hypothetical protein